MRPVKMLTPWRKPETGVFYVRKQVPARLRDRHGWELRKSLRTRDPQEARRRFPAILTALEALIDIKPEAWDAPQIILPATHASVGPTDSQATHQRPASPQESTRPSTTLKTALNGYLDDRQPRPKTALEWRKAVAQYQEQSQQRHIHQVTRQSVRAFRDHLGKSLGLAPASVKKKLTALSTVLNWSIEEGLLEVNPVSSVTVAKATKAKKRRLPYEQGDLTKIFSTSIYSNQERPKGGGGEAAKWLPWLALCSGCRLEELGQLKVNDVRQIDGIWCLDINGDGDKSLKTTTSERLVPLHSQLLTLGFLEYAQAQQGNAWLFPDLTVDCLGRRTGNWSKWWGRYARDVIGITDKQKTFHSFRHGFKDACRNAGLEEAIHDALTGHASASVGRSYGQGYGVALLKATMERIGFEIGS